MPICRRYALALAGSLALIAAGSGAMHAQDYPSRPIRVIVPTPPGGMSDLVSRTFATKVQERTGRVVVVENRTGANGVLAADYVAKSTPDSPRAA
jgi:tripartite-type tricarboxylate transporter receptor subunit TctC